MTATLDTPLVPGMIHRPDAPAHMMRIKPLRRLLTVRLGDDVIAESGRALQVIEIGRDVADPVYYVPKEDVRAALVENPRSTHCPLKGDTTYYDVDGDGEGGHEIGWSYTRPLPIAEELAEHVAFDASRVGFTSAPLP